MRIDPSEHVSEHFTWGELTVTANAALQDANRDVPDGLIPAARALATMLEAVRSHFGRPVVVHSAFRSYALNAATPGASKTSQHMRFEAADFHVDGVSLLETFRWIRDRSGLRYGQLILESRRPGPPTWVHLSLGEPWRIPGRCREALTFDGTNYHDASAT